MSLMRRWMRRRRAGRQGPEFERQPVPDFLFERRPIELQTRERINGIEQFPPSTSPGFYLRSGNDLPYRLVRLDHRSISVTEMPIFTLVSDPEASIYISGSPEADSWSVDCCAYGEGGTEEEAKQRLSGIQLDHRGGVLHLRRPLFTSTQSSEVGRSGGEVAAVGPADATVLIHASYCYVHVRDVTGSIRVSAAHARVSLLDTAGRVDAVGLCIDLATTGGDALLSAELQVNLKLRRGFSGSVTASAQRGVFMCVPSDCRTPFRAVVPRADNFACRTPFSDRVRHEGRDGYHAFTYRPAGVADDSLPITLHAEQGTIVVDSGEDA
jgi:hypothetical protein